MRSLLQALPSNSGIEHLTVTNVDELSDETWTLLFNSLWMHPRMEHVTIKDFDWDDLAAESKTTRMNAIFQMLQHNTVIRTLFLPRAFYNEEVCLNSIVPRLEMNRNCFEVQRRALKRADPSIHPQLLGRALHVVRYNPNLLFQFLSENVPAFVRTEEEEEEPSAQDSANSSYPDEPAAVVSGQKRKAP